MPRTKHKPADNAAEQPTASDNTVQQPQCEGPTPADAAAAASQANAEPKRQWTSSLPDPFGRHSIDLGDGRRLQLSRSGKWNQMQVRFVATKDGVDPKPKKEDGDTQWLRERGWNWRGDADTKAWTVQLLAPEEKELSAEEKARRRIGADRRAEDDFMELAQRIRQRNGLPPVEVFAAAERGGVGPVRHRRQAPVANPATTHEPDLPGRAAAGLHRVMEMVLGQLAARDLKEPRFRPDNCPDDLEEIIAAAQVLRVLAKPQWSEDDLDLFEAYFPAALRSEAFGDEFEEARFRIRSYVDESRQLLGHRPAARAARR